MFYLSYFPLQKHVVNTVTCFCLSYIQSAIFPVTVFFILLVRQTGIRQIYERDSGNWMSRMPPPPPSAPVPLKL